MSIIKKMRKQFAVYWERGTTPDQYGTYSFAAPVEIACRWDDKGLEYRDEKYQMQMSRAVVYPDRVLTLGSKLQKGEMESDIPEDPLESTLAFEIKKFEEIPNLKATEFLYIAYL